MTISSTDKERRKPSTVDHFTYSTCCERRGGTTQSPACTKTAPESIAGSINSLFFQSQPSCVWLFVRGNLEITFTNEEEEKNEQESLLRASLKFRDSDSPAEDPTTTASSFIPRCLRRELQRDSKIKQLNYLVITATHMCRKRTVKVLQAFLKRIKNQNFLVHFLPDCSLERFVCSDTNF